MHATWSVNANRATNAPFTIRDGAATLTTVLANQELAPNDLSDAGASWEELALVTIASGTLVVELRNNANEFVIADAVRIERVGEPPTQDLGLSLNLASISENGGSTTATVTRSGSTSGDLIVSLLSSDTSEASVPLTVTILDGQSSANFIVTGVDDTLIDGTQTLTLTASASGFTPGQSTLDVTNDDVGVIFQAQYTDAAGEGFFDATLGQARRDAFEYALDIWSSLVLSTYVGQTVVVSASFDPLGSGILGSAGPEFVHRGFSSSLSPNVWYGSALANNLDGSDISPGSAEISAQFSSNFSNWYLGTDGNTPGGQYDFVTVVLHEIGHGLNFLDLFDGNGAYLISGLPGVYDLFLEDVNGVDLTTMTQAQRATALTSNNLYWSGANATAANGGNRPRLYAPTTYSNGSSTSHLDEGTYGAELMSPFYSGVDHTISALELGMLADMGWTIAGLTPVGGGSSGSSLAGSGGSSGGSLQPDSFETVEIGLDEDHDHDHDHHHLRDRSFSMLVQWFESVSKKRSNASLLTFTPAAPPVAVI